MRVHQQDTGSMTEDIGPKVTEILFYGARISEQERSGSRLPSPPISSPSRQLLRQFADESTVEDHESHYAEFLQLFALPLSSSLLHQAMEPTTPPKSPQILSSKQFTPEITATFLPQNFNQMKTNLAQDKKRQRVTDLFTKASQRRLKAPRTVSSELTSLSRHETLHKRREKSTFLSEKSSFPGQKQHDSSNKPSQLRDSFSSYSPSFAADMSVCTYNDSNIKRSSISRAVSISNIPSPIHAESESLTARNKDVISRVVRAGLRLNGLKPRKNRSRVQRQSRTNSENLVKGEDDVKEEKLDDLSDESFKTMYHMVFRATIHTFVSRSMNCSCRA